MHPEKSPLRRHFLSLRDAAPESDRQQWSKAACQAVEAYCLSRRFRRIGLFWPIGSEIDLRYLMQAQTTWTFFFPRIASSSPPRLIWGTEPLEKGTWGLMEPIHAQHLLPPVQLLLVPGLAFDAAGYRLGYGKGFYDALLDKLNERVPALGVGFELQRTASLPVAPQDLPVQGLMTEKGLTRFEP